MAATTDATAITLYALAFLGNAGYAPIMIFLNERFPTEIRASGLDCHGISALLWAA
jgi:MFS transporter, MHS family, proline/betaine transporter